MDHLDQMITSNYLVDRTNLNNPPTFTMEAVELIRDYLHPYLHRIGQIPSVQYHEDFTRTLPPKLQHTIRVNFLNYERYTTILSLDAMKIFLANELIDAIILGDNDEYFNNTGIIDPWDVILQFRSSIIPRGLFHLNPLTPGEEDDTVPITVNVNVNINGAHAVFPMSHELVKGILTFYYYEMTVQHPLSMYGRRFNDEIIRSINNIRDYPQKGYTIEFRGDIYAFYTPYFLQGLLSAAHWSGVNARDYITNITKYDFIPGNILGQGETVITPMTYV